MPLQLTPEQEQRIQAIVSAGAYSSPEEALNAAVAAVETAAVLAFEGSNEELETLLSHGLASAQLSEDQFWSSVEGETQELLTGHSQNRVREDHLPGSGPG